MRRLLFALAILSTCVFPGAGADAKDKKEPDKKQKPLLVVGAGGGEAVEFADWRFVLGTRHFSLSGDIAVKPKSKAPGPEYLEFREDKSTTFQNGILTLVPLSSIRKIEYDKEKKTVALTVATATEENAVLNGTTRFVGINKIAIEGDLLLKGGIATEKIQGGTDKTVRRIAFPDPKAVAEPKGTLATIVAVDKEKSKHTAYDLQPLYTVDGVYRVLPYLMFKKTVKFEMDKIASLRFVPSENKKQISYDFEVTLKDGAKHTLSLLTKVDLGEKKSATFEGLVGQVPAGYKLFPPHTIQDLHIGESKEKLDTR